MIVQFEYRSLSVRQIQRVNSKTTGLTVPLFTYIDVYFLQVLTHKSGWLYGLPPAVTTLWYQTT